MLARLTEKYFSDPKWLFERKLDGERCLAFKNGNKVALKSRNNKDLNPSYPELLRAVKKLKFRQAVLDGEIIAFSKGGATSFELISRRFGVKTKEGVRASGVKVHFYIFDLPYLNGYDLTGLPLEERKKMLKKAASFKNPLALTTHVYGQGEKYHKKACLAGWEGVIAKRRDSPYAHKRSSDWLKFKCSIGQELVIGGWTEPRGSRVGFGALLVGYYKKGKLMYAGKVGTGFDTAELKDILKKLKKLESKRKPFAGDVLIGSGRWTSAKPQTEVHWVRPALVGQFAFTEWTSDSSLRHPRFLGLRRDKKPRDVIKER